ncbi:MAG: thioesterase family protein [Usitatibacteraceae bacterium]
MTVHQAEPEYGPALLSMQIPVRWGELDVVGHLNHTEYLRYFEESRARWAQAIGFPFRGTGEGMILLKASVTYKKQVNYPSKVDIALFAGEVGRSSFQMFNTLTIEGESSPAAIGEFVIVWFDFAAEKSIAIPAAVRAILEGKGTQV